MSETAPDSPPHILVVDDDTRLRDLLRRFLLDQEFVVVPAASAAEARELLAAMVFDALIVDVMMPGESGLDFTRWLRSWSSLPVLMLTARGELDDRISGLECGADDYLAKPFEPRELVLRLRSLLRRSGAAGGRGHAPPDRSPLPDREEAAAPPSPPEGTVLLQMGPHRLDLSRMELSSAEGRVHLTTAEAQLLAVLAARPHQTFSRDALAEATGTQGNPRTVDVQVTRLRKKLESDPRQPRYLQTVRGTGYILRPDS